MSASTQLSAETVAMADELCHVGATFYAKNWSLATSSNYSSVIARQPLALLMTASGKDKGNLSRSDFVIVDDQCRIVSALDPSLDPSPDPSLDPSLDPASARNALKPSAEAALHVEIARLTGAGSILHTHSMFSTLVSQKLVRQGKLKMRGLEMMKALPGIATHETEIELPIFENTQDIRSLADRLTAEMLAVCPGFLIAGHGLYTWGATIRDARRHVEALEFLIEYTWHQGEY